MSNYLVKLPAHFRSTSAFEDGRSRNRALAAALADVQQFAEPGASANPQALVSDIYTAYAGADTAANQSSLNVANALDWLSRQGINALDMQSMLWSDTEESDYRTQLLAQGRTGDEIQAAIQTAKDAKLIALKHEIQAMNMNNVLQLLVLATDDKLLNALNSQPLHNWSTPGTSQPTALIRAGFSTDVANAFYYDPALGAQFGQPVPIAWQNILDSGITGCIAVLPPGVELPPAGFTFAAGVNPDGTTAANQWPVPTPQVNADAVVAQMQAMQAAYDNLVSIVNSTSSTLKSGTQQVLASLGKG